MTVPDEDEPNEIDAIEEEVEETSIEGSDGGEDKKDLEDEETLPSEEGKQEHDQKKDSKGGGQLRIKAHAFYENGLSDRMSGRSGSSRCKLQVRFLN